MDGSYAPQNTVSNIKYIKWLELYKREKPFQILIDIPKSAPDQRYTNLVYEEKEETFYDVRGKETTYSLNDHGFTYRHHDFKFANYEDRKAVEANYLPKIEQFIRTEVDDVDKVFFFDWRLRHNAALPKGTTIDLNDPTDWLLPAVHAHVGETWTVQETRSRYISRVADQSPGAALSRTILQLPQEADFLLRGRVRIITVWKPLRNPVEDWPLGVCDGSNVDEGDLLETDHIRRQYNGANMNAIYRDKYRWHYLHHQGPEEPLLLKQFDSATNVKAIRCPHVSFQHRQIRPNAPKRESIEVRALVYTFPQDHGCPS